MPKRPGPSREPVDIFGDDGDLARAASALEGATEAAPRETTDPNGRSVAVGRSAEQVAAPRPTQQIPSGVVGEDLAPPVEPINAELKFRVRRSIRAELDSFRAELGIALGGVRLTDSHIGRAALSWLLEEARDAILAEAEGASGTLRRPPADDPVALAAFDRALAKIFLRGSRDP